MKVSDIISFLESFADPSLQEHYDNAGLIIGDKNWECNGGGIITRIQQNGH